MISPGTSIAALAAIALTACGVVYGTRAVGGSDSSCYALMAQAFASGELQPSSPLAEDAPWPDAPRTLAPGGFIPSPVRRDAASPICWPGMSVLMAPLAAWFGRDAIFWLVPASGGLLVWSAFLLARRLGGGMAGAAAAVLTATTPIVLFQVVQPMNDVLAAALWLFAFALLIDVRQPLGAGAVAGLAILVRPNLAPLAVIIAMAPLVLRWERPGPYPEWWYLRFLIPALVMLLVLTGAAGVVLAARARMAGVVPIVVVLLALLGARTAGERQAFELQRLEGRYRDTALLIGERLPANAVLITVWQSGSVRYHADRQAVLWDALDPAWLDRAVAWLRQRGLQPYFLFERREEPEFRGRFRGHSSFGALDWPPRIDLNRQVRIYDPGDRARYLAGESYPTDNQPRRK